MTFTRRDFLQKAFATVVLIPVAGCGSNGQDFVSVPTAQDPVFPSLSLNSRSFFAFDSQGTTFRLSFAEHLLERLNSSGDVVWNVTGPGLGAGSLLYSLDLAVDSSDRVYVLDTADDRIQVFSPDGVFLASLGSAGTGPGQFRASKGFDIYQDRLYIADGLNHRVVVLELDGSPVTTFGSFGLEGEGLNFPRTLAISNQGVVYVLDQGNHQIQVWTSDGTNSGRFGQEILGSPRSVAVDALGNVYVADGAAGVIHGFSSQGAHLGELLLTADDGRPAQPLDLSFDPSTGRLFVTIQIVEV